MDSTIALPLFKRLGSDSKQTEALARLSARERRPEPTCTSDMLQGVGWGSDHIILKNTLKTFVANTHQPAAAEQERTCHRRGRHSQGLLKTGSLKRRTNKPNTLTNFLATRTQQTKYQYHKSNRPTNKTALVCIRTQAFPSNRLKYMPYPVYSRTMRKPSRQCRMGQNYP